MATRNTNAKKKGGRHTGGPKQDDRASARGFTSKDVDILKRFAEEEDRKEESDKHERVVQDAADELEVEDTKKCKC